MRVHEDPASRVGKSLSRQDEEIYPVLARRLGAYFIYWRRMSVKAYNL